MIAGTRTLWVWWANVLDESVRIRAGRPRGVRIEREDSDFCPGSWSAHRRSRPTCAHPRLRERPEVMSHLDKTGFESAPIRYLVGAFRLQSGAWAPEEKKNSMM